MKRKYGLFFFCVLIFTICSCSKTRVLIAEQSRQKPYKMQLQSIWRTQSTIILESDNPMPDDLKFLSENRICYLGNRVIELKNIGDEQVVQTKKSIPNSLSEQFFSMVLQNDNFIVIDSLDFSYYSDELVEKDEFVLLGYDSTLTNKAFSLTIGKEDFVFKWYLSSPIPKSLRYIYYPEYSPKSSSANNWTIRLKVIDIKENRTQVFDSIYASNSDSVFHYFNPRYLRDEGNGKLSYLRMDISPINNSKVHISVFSWDYEKQIKEKEFDFEIDKIFNSDNFKHRIMGNAILLGYDSGILKLSKNGKRKIIYSTDKYKLLDFIPFEIRTNSPIILNFK